MIPTFPGLNLRHRLAIIFLLCTLLGAWVVAGVWSALERTAEADRGEDALGKAQRLHQDADMMHDALRADVYAAFLRLGEPAGDLMAHRQALDADLRALDALALPPEVTAALLQCRGPLLAWADDAAAISRVAATDPGAAARLAAFNTAFEAVAQSMEAATNTLTAARAAEEEDVASDRAEVRRGVAFRTGSAVVVSCLAIAMVGLQALTALGRVREVAWKLGAGDLSARNVHIGADEIGDLARTFNELGENLQRMTAQHQAEAARLRFAGQLGQAMDMAETEADVIGVVQVALKEIGGHTGADLMLSDSSRAKLKVVTGDSAVGCDVGTPWACVAMRRATPMTFPSNAAMDCCPRLRGAAPCSAVCLPVNFTGRAIGVLRTIGVPDSVHPDSAERLATLANQAGARLGAIRAMEKVQLQASTDGLTGLLNRRSLEARVRQLTEPYAVIMADLDHFKKLNDTFGHPAGDHALRLFGQTVRSQQRTDDIACRYGGEEFVLVMPNCTAPLAVQAADRIRAALAASFTGSAPPFTVSCGVADSTMRGSFEEVLQAADAALYTAKAQGRDRAVSA